MLSPRFRRTSSITPLIKNAVPTNTKAVVVHHVRPTAMHPKITAAPAISKIIDILSSDGVRYPPKGSGAFAPERIHRLSIWAIAVIKAATPIRTFARASSSFAVWFRCPFFFLPIGFTPFPFDVPIISYCYQYVKHFSKVFAGLFAFFTSDSITNSQCN